MPGHTIFPSITPDGDDSEDDVDRVTELADANYQTVVATVRAGDVDDRLDDLEEADDRTTVQDAIAQRRDDLEGDTDAESEN